MTVITTGLIPREWRAFDFHALCRFNLLGGWDRSAVLRVVCTEERLFALLTIFSLATSSG